MSCNNYMCNHLLNYQMIAINNISLLAVQTSTEEGKQEKKTDQPPQAKKPKVKTKVLDLPIENNPQWQLANDMLNLFVESEVGFLSS